MIDDLVELDVGAPGHGGFCVARHEGRVVFVRHALPGERVRARVSEDAGSYLRADAVEILIGSPDRVPPPCPYAGPGRCGGCDWQHATGLAQRELKAAVVREQFSRVARTDVALLLAAVEELPGGLLGWRTRIAYAVGAEHRLGLRRHRSHEIEPVDRCLLGAPGVERPPQDAAPGVIAVELVRGDDGTVAVVEHRPGHASGRRGRRPPDQAHVVSGPARLAHSLGGRTYQVAASGFWQVHQRALPVLSAALLSALDPQPGETVLELFAGAGALTAVLAEAVGPAGRVIGVEADRTAVADAADNLADLPWAEVQRGRVGPAQVRQADPRPDLVVLDPPRSGAGPEVIRAIAELGPRAIGYVSCDPATLARDVRAAADAGYPLTGLRAFDAFPMTHHVECLAILAANPAAPQVPSSATKSDAARTL